MEELARPFMKLWDWIEQVGGFPGKMVAVCLAVMLVIAGLTWYGNKR